MDKSSLLDTMMQDVKECALCCKVGQGIKSEKLLRNFIAERPHGPLYGGVPSMWTDWASRLEAKIVVVGKDWGTWNGPRGVNKHRQTYEERVRASGDDKDLAIWRKMIRKYGWEDNSSRNVIEFFMGSARFEGVELPEDFMGGVYVTNPVLCARANGTAFSGSNNFDAVRSVNNCCDDKKFLKRQLEIVKPVIVVALGEVALRGLGLFEGSLHNTIESLHASDKFYISKNYYGLPLNVVPVYHPAARPRDRTCLEQMQDYWFIWKALSDIIGIPIQSVIPLAF